MTSKEMEARSGVPRANIRYYEVEGLLHPERLKNGYRSYSEEDLRTLEKIKLLRRLGVSVEEVRELVRGGETMETVLDRRLAALGGQRASLGRVQAVCGALRDAGVSFDELDAGRYLQDLDAPALPEENGTWWTKTQAPDLPAGDALPTVYNVPRRLLARLFDCLLVTLALLAALCLAGYNPARANSLAISLGITVLLGLLEPLCLRLFAATPGKALLGMRLTAPDGEKLSYGAGVNRYLRMLWHGLGCYIPIWSLVQLYRSAARCANQEPQPWDDGVAYTAKPFRLRYAASLILTVLLVLIVGEAVNSWSQLPPNRGDLTVAEFAENYNRQAEYLDFGGRAYLDEDGQWQERPEDGSQIISLEDLMDVNPWDDAKAFHYTVEDGHVTAVTMSGTFQNTTAMWVETPDSYVPQIVTALVWGRREAPFWSLSRQAQLREQEEADWERGFTLHQPGVVITAEVEQTGFCYFQGMGWQPVEEGNRLSFTYTVALDNG